MRFFADCMLGTLAKWLIILGHDVRFLTKIEDGTLVALAAQERRIILTRDRRLVMRRAARNHILIRSQDLEHQIRQVLDERHLPIRADRLFRRCVRCNRPTRTVTRETVRGRVPPYVFKTQRRFTRCPSCSQIYWRATHVVSMLERLHKQSARGR
ncbi:MAG: Mut7-C RNAse domain-containing protein [Acidobacteria bacterium]|nr:Mut7-C RNAse domain-containing protein [Acidobacteriota bacterium]